MLCGYVACIGTNSHVTQDAKMLHNCQKTQVNYYWQFKTVYFELSGWGFQGKKSGWWGGGGWEVADLPLGGLKYTGTRDVIAKESYGSVHHRIR